MQHKTINEGKSSFALRLGSTIIDKSTTHEFAGPYQTDTALQCLRFLDSDTKYEERDISLLLRAIQINKKKDRQKWFESVNSCRRRRRVNLGASSLRVVFQTSDEFFVLQDRAFMSRVRTAINSRGLYVYDAFRAFDTDRNGVLGCTELYSGMCWLGLAVKPEDIYRLIRHIDSDNDGYISFFDFKSALDMYAGNVSVDKSFKKEEFNSVVPQQKIQEFYEMEDGAIRKTSRKVSQGELQKFRVSQKPAIGYECVWTSRGTMSRAKCSIWIPNLKRGFMAPKHKKRICIGYYANVGYGDPRSSGSIAGIGLNLLELTDYTHPGVRFTGSKIITIVRDKFCPHPIRFHQVWSQYKGEKPLFAWEPIPPSEDFRSLGMIVTTSDTAPPLTCVRCIPKRWTKKSTIVPRLVWNDAGTGGRAGSIWIVNELGLIWVKSGHDPPEGPFYTVKGEKFYVGGHELDEETEDDTLSDFQKARAVVNSRKTLNPAEAARIRELMIEEQKKVSEQGVGI